MMNSNEIRTAFLEFFRSKQHEIVPSAPMVVKNDPTLMFTNAGMNQFKDIFLGNSPIKFKRVANTQKCLRVSGKHNDLEEVGHDTYHHTMFEMLGNWSFGDYFKKEAIGWAWEFLTEVLKLDKSRLYVTVFEGSKDDQLDMDSEALNIWKQYISEDKIIMGSKKDNFWEMGDTGPCGPCSEIHIDIRSDEEIKKVPGKGLVNQSDPLVIEIWNNVFIQYNRKANGQLENLPSKHIDTGMGFERLCMAMQGKQSNYDTDVFQPIIKEVGRISGRKYGENKEADIAMRVVADHLRAIAFAIADGQLPSNNKAGYVIRRILRRAVRYGFTFLDLKEPFITLLVPVLAETMGAAFPELKSQQGLIETVIREEELAFLRTLETGIRLLDQIIKKAKSQKLSVIDGKTAFELYDTYGFPLDLTELILKEKGMSVDLAEFELEMGAQKKRSRVDAVVDSGDWIQLQNSDKEEFVGYDQLNAEVKITKYRKVVTKGKEYFQLVFNVTPFYAESGGQVGDTGYLETDGGKVFIIETKKENNLPIHLAEKLPSDPSAVFKAIVTESKRRQTESNHSATHLLHNTLRKVLGTHVEQKGSLVNPDYLRFDFSHFQKVTDEQLAEVSKIVNAKIRENIYLDEKRGVPMKEAVKFGAMALFGEKYGDSVRVIKFGDSVELCGGTHVKATGQIGYFKIVSESAIAAGIRRIEAVTGLKAEEYLNHQNELLKEISDLLKTSQNIKKSVENLISENSLLNKQIEGFVKEKVNSLTDDLATKVKNFNGINYIAEVIVIDSVTTLKELAIHLKARFDHLFLVIGANISGKVSLTVMVSEDLVKEKSLHAGNIVKEIAKEIGGSGGGQPFYATAGGTNPDGLRNAVEKALSICGIKG